MLTKEQVDDAVTALTCADAECHWCVNMREVAAAYERVAALRDDMRAKADRDLSGTHTHFANLLDRALYGDADDKAGG